jgi:two-component system cell cycle sensor histidine kinase/response regulator CckA
MMTATEKRDSRHSRKPLRVLYLEDNLLDAKLHSRQLENAGFNLDADIVESPEEFANALHSKTYDIVLADFRLPAWSGIDALEMLKREGKDIPFILLTGTVGEEVAVECIKKGATDYVLKDRPARLSSAVQRALDEKAARDERAHVERSRDLLASIVESSEDAIIGMTLEGTIVSWNVGAAHIYGYSLEQIINRPIFLLFADDAAHTLSKCLEVLRNGKSIDRSEMAGVTRDRRPIDVAVTMSPLYEANGTIAGASAIARDITEHKRLQKELFLAQKMEAIGRLAAGVAHDFNNLLTVVTGYCSMALDQVSEQDPLHEELREIHKAGERAASLTQQLLAFSRKQILQPRVLDLNAIVADMDRMLRRVIGEDVDLVAMLDPQLGHVRADPAQIEQVIVNLVVNARDAMPKGGKLSIETANVDLNDISNWPHLAVSPGAYVMVAISDTGIGMDPETQARIFEPFFTTKNQGTGTGLGLSTVYGIIEQSGGTVFVYSEVGRGTTFKIYLPRVQEAPATLEAAPLVVSPSGSETILVVEDADAVRKMVCRILQQQGYTVLAAQSGDEAVLLCEQHTTKINLMVTDVVLTGMSGSELAIRLGSLRPEMKVIYMSGYTDNAIVRHGVLTQEATFLQKPFAPQALACKVREVLEAEA